MALITYLTRIQVDFGALKLLDAELQLLGIRRPLIVTDKGIIAAGLWARVKDHLPGNMPLTIYDGTPENPTEAAMNSAIACGQSPCATSDNAAVIATAMAENATSQVFFADPRSAIAPSIGASKATTILAAELAMPSCKVLDAESPSALQNCLRNSGKKAETTVSANAEFAQS